MHAATLESSHPVDTGSAREIRLQPVEKDDDDDNKTLESSQSLDADVVRETRRQYNGNITDERWRETQRLLTEEQTRTHSLEKLVAQLEKDLERLYTESAFQASLRFAFDTTNGIETRNADLKASVLRTRIDASVCDDDVRKMKHEIQELQLQQDRDDTRLSLLREESARLENERQSLVRKVNDCKASLAELSEERDKLREVVLWKEREIETVAADNRRAEMKLSTDESLYQETRKRTEAVAQDAEKLRSDKYTLESDGAIRTPKSKARPLLTIHRTSSVDLNIEEDPQQRNSVTKPKRRTAKSDPFTLVETKSAAERVRRRQKHVQDSRRVVTFQEVGSR